MKNILVVYNNKAGNSKKFCKRLIYEKFKTYFSKVRLLKIDQLENYKFINNYEIIIAAGGDGTVLRVLPLVVNNGKNLGIIPCGTANLFAASLGIPNNLKKALDIIISGETALVDIGKAGNRYFSLRVGVGFDADIINNSNSWLKNKIGYFAYFINGLYSALRLSRKNYRLIIDGKEMEVNANSIIIANSGNMFKKFFTVSPKGSLNDGKLDIFIPMAKNFRDFLEIFLQILLNKHKDSSKVIYNQAKSIIIENLTEKFHIDGEGYLVNSTTSIHIIPCAVRVMVANSG
jgi:diacylglycerol kinase (ATP)